MLTPFWGPVGSPEGDPDQGRYDRYIGMGQTLFSLTEFDESDVAVLPIHWETAEKDPATVEAARQLDDRCARAGKPLVVFFVSDSAAPVPLDNAIIYRTSMLRSRRSLREHAMPAFVKDFRTAYAPDDPAERPWTPRPLVSFCGFAPPPQRLRRLIPVLGRRAHSADTRIRWDACSSLRRDSRIDTAFIMRDAFWGGAFSEDRVPDVATMARVRREYVDSVFRSDYVLCARGGGNFSYRLYETLGVGRIPLFIDTECVLPFEDKIDWRSLVVWVGQRSVDNSGEILLLEHESLRGEAFAYRQRRCREVFESAVSIEGFFRRLATTRMS